MKTQKVRLFGLLFFMIFIVYLALRHEIQPIIFAPVGAYCPLDGLEGIYEYLRTGSWITRLAMSSIILFIAVIVSTLLFGRVFCGWVCPLGSLAELANLCGKKMGIRSLHIPKSIDTLLRYVKYLFLAFILMMAWRSVYQLFNGFDLWVAWVNIFGEDYASIALHGSVIILVIISSFWIERFWCRYLCPLGACFAKANKYSLSKLHRDEKTCLKCIACDSICSMNINPSQSATLTNVDCIACGKCIDVCKSKTTLSFKFYRQNISVLALAMLAFILFVGICGITMITGVWHTRSTVVTAGFSADSITGNMTIHELGILTGLGSKTIREMTGVPMSFLGDRPINELGEDSVRTIKIKIREWFKTNNAVFTADSITGEMSIHDIGVITGLGGKKVKEITGAPEQFSGDEPISKLGEDGLMQFRSKMREWLKDNPLKDDNNSESKM